jgi:hypothetical protein
MKTITTKKAGMGLFSSPDQRRNAADVITLSNESGTTTLQLVCSEAEEFEQDHRVSIDSDIIPDGIMAQILDDLAAENRLKDEIQNPRQ